jgi:hypothetical protein
VILFNVLRQMEIWLHQHIFKVGWLLTQNYQTTTVLYYTFFLPGVMLYEIVIWLSAAILDVRAERAITWPEKQEIGELRLNFVRITKKASRLKVALINLMPLITGILIVWFVAENILRVQDALALMGGGTLDGFGAAIGQLTRSSDFWLWTYILFTITNTMIPTGRVELPGWQWALIAVAVISVVLFALGLGQDILGQAIDGPVSTAINVVSGVFTVMIALNLFGIAFLGGVEALVERGTGNSATFKNGKMITMKRSDLLAQRAQERQKQLTARTPSAQQRRGSALPARAGARSIYDLPLPIPGPPGAAEPVTQPRIAIIEVDEPEAPKPAEAPRRVEPAIISGRARDRADDDAPMTPTPPSRQLVINAPRPFAAASLRDELREDDEDDESTEDDGNEDQAADDDLQEHDADPDEDDPEDDDLDDDDMPD